MEAAPDAPDGFVTPRLELRRITDDDLDHLAAVYAVPSVVRHLSRQVPSLDWTRDQLLAFARHWERYGFGQSAVIELSTGDFVGRVGLQMREPWHEVELRYVIARHRQHRRYATEAGRVWVAWARENGLADRLVVVIHPGHEAALRTARTLGFRPDPDHPTAWAGGRLVHSLEPLDASTPD